MATLRSAIRNVPW